MRSDWKKATIADLCLVVTDGSHYSPKSVEQGKYMVSVKDFTPYGFNFSECRKISDADYDQLRKNGCVPEQNDILIGKDGARFFEDIIIYHQPEEPALLSSIAILRADKSKILPEYLYYTLKTPTYKKDVRENYGSGSAIPRIILKDFKRMPVWFPKLSEQKRITEILSSIDQKIKTNSEINDNLLQQAQAIYAEWCLQCPEQVEIGTVVDNILDYTPNPHPEVVLVNSSEVTEGHFDHHNLSENANLKGHFKKRFQKYDVLYSEIRPKNKHYAYVLFDADKYIASTRLMVIRAKREIITPSLLYQHLSSQRVCDEFASTTETRSGTFPQGCFADLSKITIPYQPIEQQMEISGFLDSVYSTIDQNDSENRRLAELRDALLPRLMSGDIDVSDIQF